MKPCLYVFAGKPCSGKSTVIRRLFPELPHIDVFPYVMAFKKKGLIPESKTKLAYRNLYAELSRVKVPAVLELGSNHPEFNVAQLKKLQKRFDIQIFLCRVNKKNGYARLRMRSRDLTEALVRRYARDFPNSYLAPLMKTNLRYDVVNMNGSIKETLQIFKRVLA